MIQIEYLFNINKNYKKAIHREFFEKWKKQTI